MVLNKKAMSLEGIIVGMIIALLVLIVLGSMFMSNAKQLNFMGKKSNYLDSYCEDVAFDLNEGTKIRWNYSLISTNEDSACRKIAKEKSKICSSKCSNDLFKIYQTKEYRDDRSFCCVYRVE